jgi:uncharacterized protein (UPF0332 family)
MLKDKSAKNLQAGAALAALGLVDPAATRYYYSMFQAAVHRLTALGWTPARLEMGAVKWSHAMVAGNVFLVRRRRDDRDLFRDMRRIREQADYADDSVANEELALGVAAAKAFVEEALR